MTKPRDIDDNALDVARELFTYEPETGQFFWRQDRYRGVRTARHPEGQLFIKAGSAARGKVCSGGYVRFCFPVRGRSRSFAAHRLAMAFVLGRDPGTEFEVDHINGDRTDNRSSNLRLCTRSGNAANARIRKDNKSGFKGVTKRGQEWLASIKKDKKTLHIGVFQTPEDAHAAYVTAAAKLHGEFANDGVSR